MKQFKNLDKVMKKINHSKNGTILNVKQTFLVVAITFMAINTMAQTWNCGANGNNLTATLTGETLTISGIGDMIDYGTTTDRPWHTVCATITKLNIENGVTSIGQRAFFDCTGLTSVIIPKSVTSIGQRAFYNCSALKELTIEDSDSELSIIGIAFSGSGYPSSFYNCPIETLYYGRNLSISTINNPNIESAFGYSIKDVIISNSVTAIAWGSFKGCSKLVSVTIPSSVVNIRNDAFWGCTGLDTLICKATTPPAIKEYTFGVPSTTKVIVPCHTSSAYQNSDWKNNFTNFIEDCASGINEISQNGISMYPNPTSGQLIIDNGQLTIKNVEIYDIVGQKVNYQLSTVNYQLSIDISHLPKGIYNVKVVSVGGVIGNSKIVKQ